MRAILVCVSFVLAGFSVQAIAQVKAPKGFASKAGQSEGATCSGVIEEGNTSCITSANAEGTVAAEAANQSAGDPTSTVEGAQAAQSAFKLGSLANYNTARRCKSAMNSCKNTCATSINNLINQKTFEEQQAQRKESSGNQAMMAQAPAHRAEAAAIQTDITTLKAARTECVSTFGARYADAARAGGESLGNINKAIGVETAATGGTGEVGTAANGAAGGKDGQLPVDKSIGDTLWDNKGKIALGAVGVVALKNMLDKDDDSNPEADAANELARAAAADPTCQSDRSYEFSHCQKYLKSLCAKPAEMSNSKCVKFADQYCGFNESTKPKVAGAPAEGLDTQLCADVMANSYCSKVNRESCFSCLRMRDMATATCQAQPASCVRTPSDAEMSKFKATCNDDPVFATPKWAHITLPPTNGTAASMSTAVMSGATGSIMGDGSSASLASKTSNLPSDVTPALAGPTAMAQMSLTIQKLCSEGALNNCGTRISQ